MYASQRMREDIEFEKVQKKEQAAMFNFPRTKVDALLGADPSTYDALTGAIPFNVRTEQASPSPVSIANPVDNSSRIIDQAPSSSAAAAAAKNNVNGLKEQEEEEEGPYGHRVPFPHHPFSAYQGREYSEGDVDAALYEFDSWIDVTRFGSPEELVEDAARVIAKEGKVVAWFQGRSEFGQRALGARSILADPRNADIRR